MSGIENNLQGTGARKSKHRMIWLILLALLIGFVATLWPKPNSLVYEGKTIGEWFDEAANKHQTIYFPPPTSPSARDAFEYFGARAQPFLLQWAQKKPPVLSKFRDRWLSSLPKPMQPWLGKIHSQEWYIERRRFALATLGFVEQWERERPGGDKHAAARLATNALPVLEPALRDSDKTVRLTAVYTLRNLGEAAWPSIPHLVKATGDSYPQVAIVAIQILGGMGVSATNALPKLAVIAGDPTNLLRVEAVKALGAIGPAARTVSPMLASFLVDPTDQPQPRNSESPEPDSIAGLADRLRGAGRLATKHGSLLEPPARSTTVGQLQPGLPSRTFEPLTLKSSTGPVVTYANPSMQMTGPNDLQFQEAVADALARIGEIPKEAEAMLHQRLQVEGPNQVELAVAMWQGNSKDTSAERYLISELRSTEWLHRMRAARLVGELGTNAAVFLSDLRRLLEDSQLFVRKNATSAVQRVSTTPP